ncbi:FkbM family methyltransferase [Flavobacterium sp. ACAM 123]|uniref:FkbM family methyltransferase n=1 Tax=Flavobacterium sp. ACAM 123 TaxID=1189620 RepID=UPI0009FC0D2A|nr:FkbM family methyltransferase [Flavobacterium sp. ACAM 123]
MATLLFFEKFNLWDGICVEPNPVVFDKLNSFRKSKNLNVCIGNENKKVQFTQIEGYCEMLSGITEKYDSRHLLRIENHIISKGGRKSEIEVDMITLDSIHELDKETIDFMSIDTEGNEYEIIRSIKFDLFNVKVLVVENNFRENRISNYLDSFGFELIYKLDCDEVFINKKYYSLEVRRRLLFWKIESNLKRKMAKLIARF